MTQFIFVRPIEGQEPVVNYGRFVSDDAARRYARQENFPYYGTEDPRIVNKWHVKDTDEDVAVFGDAVIPAISAPGQAFSNAFAPKPTRQWFDAVDESTGSSWAALIASEGQTSDVALNDVTEPGRDDLSEVYVAPDVVLYNVTRTVEITVPVYAADKTGAVRAVEDISSINLILNAAGDTKLLGTVARIRA